MHPPGRNQIVEWVKNCPTRNHCAATRLLLTTLTKRGSSQRFGSLDRLEARQAIRAQDGKATNSGDQSPIEAKAGHFALVKSLRKKKVEKSLV